MISCNIDLYVAGCSTNCKHCYVDGGPAKSTEIENISYAMKRLESLLPQIGDLGMEMSVTLDNEPANHSDAVKIYDLAKSHLKEYYFHHGSTTGIPLLNHKDKEAVTETMLKHGYGQVGLTIHGGHDSHDKMVRNSSGMNSLIDAGKYMYQKNFHVVLSFMLSKILIQDREKIADIINTIPHQGVYFAVTNVSPVERMQDYQKYRASLEDVYKLKGYLSKWGFDEDKVFRKLEVCNEKYFLDELNKLNSWEEVTGSKSNIYLSLDRNLNLSYGNTGLEIFSIGNLKSLSDKDIISSFKTLKANDCYWDSYFKREALPDLKDFIEKIYKVRTENYIYPNMDSFLVYWLKKFEYDV